jgi:NitT/TauT family transport system substrate-binding protein
MTLKITSSLPSRPLLGAILILLGAMALTGCHRNTGATKPTTITLDWKPEPEFGGFYQAELAGSFKNRDLSVELKSGGVGAPMWQLVASGQTEFATTAADEVLVARARGADVVAVFAVYQTFPQGIMVHKARSFQSIADVFNHPGILAAEDATWLKFLLGKFGPPKVSIIPYGSGVATFLAKPDYSQQCFVTSEPLLAAAQGGDPQTFLIADAGFNPYTTVLITRGDTIQNHPKKVKAIVDACREGWRQYLDDPSAANAAMGKLNPEMDAKTFAQAAAAQKPLIETAETKSRGLGTMSADRWNELSKQLVDLKVLVKPIPAENCFVDVDKLP